ncbi:MAG TPA: Ig-like domain-containing protein [Mobilitalea sp.]|nr:Ig-like domain-containing protein [Mobilitalea sp.]
MIRLKKSGYFVIFSMLFTLAILFLDKNYAKATEPIPITTPTPTPVLPEDYYFVYNGHEYDDKSQLELNTSQRQIYVSAEGWDPGTTVSWISSEPGVIAIETSTSSPSNYVNLKRIGPGFSTISAIVSYGTGTYTLNCHVKVNLAFDVQKTKLDEAQTTGKKILSIDNVGDTAQIYLKYVDYDAVSVSGAAITTGVNWTSDNEGVATVDENGLVTAIGGGSAKITATSTTLSVNDIPMEIDLTAVVAPSFGFEYDVSKGDTTIHHNEHSTGTPNTAVPAVDVPVNFVIESNATRADNLKWEVYTVNTNTTTHVTKKKKLPASGPKLTYSISDISGNVIFNAVKAGTYEIYAFADDDFNDKTSAPYAYMKIIVPIVINDLSIVMNVGDTYNIVENSNIPDMDIFTATYTEESDQSVALLGPDGVIKAKEYGMVRIHLSYRTEYDLFDNNVINDKTVTGEFDIDVRVVDDISLTTTSATLYTSGTLLLHAMVTNPTQIIEWSSSNDKVATVEGGLVTGLKPGVVTITAQQNIFGVIKRATCKITIQQSVTTVTLDPDKVTIPIGGYQTMLATITPKNLAGVELTWKSSNDSIVTIVNYNSLTATVQGMSGGHAVISAINQDNVVVGYCHVSVQQPVTSIVLSETEVTIDFNIKKLQLRATAYPENAQNKLVNWSSTDDSIAKVDQNGLVTFVKEGKVSIIATSDDSPVVRAICNLTISIPVVSVTLDEREKTMFVGQSERLTYLVLPTNASKNSVIWTSTNPKVATVDGTGKVSAKGVGSTVIILKTLDGSYSVYCTISVKKIATGVKFDVAKLDLKAGEYYVIKPEFTPKDSTEISLFWESSDTKVATVDSNGKVIAKGAGSAIIMAKTESGAITYCKVTVTQPVEGLLLNFDEKTIYVGEKFELTVSVSPSKATELGVIWKSTNPKVATVSKNGEVVGLAGGTTLITCTTLDGGYSATCVIIVRELVTTIKLDYESYRLGIDKSIILTATVSTQTATNQKVTWKSSNTKVATVSKKGKVTGHALGFATITATAQDGSEVEASCDIEVVRPVTRVVLSKGYMAMLVGEVKQIKATLEPKKATYNKAIWRSSDDKIAIVDEDGFVTAISPGTTTITAEAQDNSGKKAVCYITVSNRVPATGVTLVDKRLVMVPGETKIVEVRLNPVNTSDKLAWSSDNSAVAKVDKNTGKITARMTGTANITVITDSGKTATIEVVVVGLNMTKLTLEQYSRYTLYVEGATTPVRWDVDNSNIAVVRNGVVESKATGTTTITATVNGRRLTCTLKVIKQP